MIEGMIGDTTIALCGVCMRSSTGRGSPSNLVHVGGSCFGDPGGQEFGVAVAC
jgi:hypothetical protein